MHVHTRSMLMRATNSNSWFAPCSFCPTAPCVRAHLHSCRLIFPAAHCGHGCCYCMAVDVTQCDCAHCFTLCHVHKRTCSGGWSGCGCWQLNWCWNCSGCVWVVSLCDEVHVHTCAAPSSIGWCGHSVMFVAAFSGLLLVSAGLWLATL